MSTAQLSPADPALTRPDHGRTIRLDIEGMRTIAVGSVLVAHAGIPFMAGGFVGVDVFFVLSGFLITGLLAREVSRSGRVSLTNFWSRRVKRLLPASATVLAFSTLITYLYLPITQRREFGGDIISAALYVVNWRLADRGANYLAEDVGRSPVQHYWSLAVEEQFYVVWPILMLVIGVIAARRWKQCAFVVLGVVTVLSFAYSVQQTGKSPATAYFVSTTRIWELGIGALLALSATRIEQLPSRLRAIGGWVGIGLVAYAIFFFNTGTTWPGANALVPTVGAALMIQSGLRKTPGSPQRLLSLPPMVFIGGLSYSIYLWHWPILIAAEAARPDMRLRFVVVLMILSIIPAYLCNRFIENPIRFGTRFKPTRRGLGLGLALTLIGVALGFGLSASAVDSSREASKAEAIGAAAIAAPASKGVVWSDLTSVKHMRPQPLDAGSDRPPLYTDQPECQVAREVSVPKLCEFGDTSSDKVVVIVGDSKILQWSTALNDLGRAQGWKLVTITKSACPFTDATISMYSKPWAECREWGKRALDDIIQLKPALVITSHGTASALADGAPASAAPTRVAMADGMARYWKTITNAGIPVAALLDNPNPLNGAVYECVAANPTALEKCSFDKKRGIEKSGALTARMAADQVPAVKVVDMTDIVCPDSDRCAPVIGKVLVYRQGSHITRTYIDSMEPQLSGKLYTATKGDIGSR